MLICIYIRRIFCNSMPELGFCSISEKIFGTLVAYLRTLVAYLRTLVAYLSVLIDNI